MNGKSYTEDSLAEIASKYTSLTEFRKKEKPAYSAMQRRGLIDKLCSHMKRNKDVKTKEELANIAAGYDNIYEFRQKEPSAYNSISKRGLIKKLCSHMKRRLPYNGRTDEELAAIASKYNIMKDFREKEPTVYRCITIRGLVDKLCSHMKRSPRVKSEEELAEITSKYDDYSDFCKKEPLICKRIRQRGLIEKLCGHMKRSIRNNMTKEKLAEIALRYKSIKELQRNDPSAYSLIYRNGFTQELFSHMERHTRHLTDQELADIALGYKSRVEFAKGDRAAYSVAWSRGILDEICSHMERLVKQVEHLNKEQCRSEALKYDNKKDFMEGSPSAFRTASYHDWLKDICGHMKPRGNWVKRKVYTFLFSDGYAYVGLTQDIKRRFHEHVSNHKRVSPVYRHIQETGASYEFKELTGWLGIDKAGKIEDSYIKKFASDGWKMLNRSNGGSLGASIQPYYTDRLIKREIAKYEYYKDFRKGSRSYYRFLLSRHLIDKYCSGLKRMRPPKRNWTLEDAIAVTSEFRTRTELFKKYPKAGRLLRESGLLDKYLPKCENVRRG